MKRKGSILLAVASASVLALGAVPSSSGAADLSDVCDSLIGSEVDNINLSPLANINLSTCKEASAPTCGPLSTIDLGVVRVSYSICKP